MVWRGLPWQVALSRGPGKLRAAFPHLLLLLHPSAAFLKKFQLRGHLGYLGREAMGGVGAQDKGAFRQGGAPELQERLLLWPEPWPGGLGCPMGSAGGPPHL